MRRSRDQVSYQGKRWSVLGFKPESGELMLARDGYRLITLAELSSANPGRQLQIGEQYSIERGLDYFEDGWKLALVRADGWLVMTRAHAHRVTVRASEIS